MKEAWFKNKWVTVLLHAAFWVLLIVVPFLLQPSMQDGHPKAPRPPQAAFDFFNVVKGIFWMVVFYLNVYVLVPRLVNRKKYWQFGFVLLLVIGSLSLLEITYFSVAGFNRPVRLGGFIVFNLFPFLFIMTASTAYRMFTDKAAEEKKVKEKEAENLKTELSFLRSQISPHFMFNVLNNIVALARKRSDQVEPTLIKLSTIMRYFLYENANDTISLKKEIEYLKNYIELQEQRFGGTTVVKQELHEPDAPYQIEPMLLIPFVENAFKHGILQNGSIAVVLEAKDGILNFSVANRYRRINEEKKDETSGIGLANVRRRLNLLYDKRHELSIDDRNEMFMVSLQIKLHE